MADDVDLANPTGTAAADDIGSKLYQKIKAGWGADGTWNETDTGAALAFPVKVVHTTDDLGAGTGGSRTQRVIVDSSQLASNVTTAQALSAGAQLVTLPTDQPNVPVVLHPSTDTGASLRTFKSLDLDESEETVKATAGLVFGAWVTNTALTTRWLHFYDDTGPTVGTTGSKISIAIPGNASDDVSGMLNVGGLGIPFGTAITVGASAGPVDTGGCDTGDVIANVFFK
jgi:hypothetical protein